MPARPRHGNAAIEYTFHHDLELGRGWTITISQDGKTFTLRCKRGMQFTVPQHPSFGAGALLKLHIRNHDHAKGHGKAE